MSRQHHVQAAGPRAMRAAFGPAPPIDEPALRAHLRRAEQAIGARLVLACARERLVSFELSDMSIRTCNITVPLRRLRAFELHAPDEAACDLPALPELLERLLGDRLAVDARPRVFDELTDSACNLALARLVADLRDRACSEGQPWPAPRDPEHLVVDGHPWHPMCKTRLGLDLEENLQYGPDHLARGPVHAVDIAADHCALAGEFLAIVRELFPAPAPGWIRIPVHALQLRRLPRLLGDRIWRAHVRPTDLRPLPARALLSLRTVALAEHPLHLKLAADIHTTSARRTVSPQSVHNGPQIAALLARIQARDPDTRRGLRIQPDLAAAGLDMRHGAIAPHLGVIVRPDPAPLVRELASETLTPGLHAPAPALVVCAALGARRPGGDLLLRELAADYPGDLRTRLAAFFADYLDRLVPPILRFWTAHGVALEAHLQNTSLVFAGRPRGFVVRDLGGIRVHRGRLAAAGHALDLAPGSFTITDDLAEAQGKLLHTLVHAHLAALIGWIDDLGGPDPEELWSRVRAVLERHLAAWARVPEFARACAEDRALLFAPTSRAKALLTMRLERRVSDYAYTEVANALAAGYPPGAA